MNLKQSMAALLWASMVVLGESSPEPRPAADPFEVFTITADNITARLIPYGARLISLHVPDKEGTPQDVVVGYDDPTQYLNDTQTSHTYFGAVIGRIANRIKNGSFTLDGTEYNIPKNHDALYTLHGGNVGYDQQNWTVTAYTSSSVTFALYDNAAEGFPGDIVTHATYTVDSKRTPDNPQGSPRLVTELISLALTESTPIMLSNHIYWNLNAFKQPTILDDAWLQLPLSRRFIETDSNQIPTGVIAIVEDSDHNSMDFTSGKTIGQDISYTEGLCGPGCIGYDHCFIIDRDSLYATADDNLVPALRWHSSTTGISMEVATNQPAIQVFTCLNMDGTIPVKPSQVERNGKDKEAAGSVEKYGCLAIEPEGWVDSINHPEWGQDVVYSPGDLPAINYATYTFGTI